jgi:hypothetical protein
MTTTMPNRCAVASAVSVDVEQNGEGADVIVIRFEHRPMTMVEVLTPEQARGLIKALAQHVL